MAIIKSGPDIGFSGTVDGITYSVQPNGTTVAKRKNGKSSKLPTIDQQATQADTNIFAQFLKPFQEFILVGYDLEAKAIGQNHNNVMVTVNRKKSLQGIYPNRSVDASKVLITKGSLPAAAKTAVTMTAAGLAFTWNTELVPDHTHYSDQVIMLAYFPELNETRYITSRAQRYLGKDLLILDGIKKGKKAHVYISFTNDRRNISNSIYLGQLIW